MDEGTGGGGMKGKDGLVCGCGVAYVVVVALGCGCFY